MNMKLNELFDNVNDEFALMEFPDHLATDSRDVVNGGAFIALEGEKTDGHNYINQAINNGAGLIIVRTGKKPDNINIPVIELDNPEKDLALIASKKLKKHNLQETICITGSVGKTTTRAALEKILSTHFKIHAPVRSLNTLIGCTAMPIDTEILILEFGANKPGEIRELTDYFPPTMSVLTAIAPVHLEGFGNIEGVLREKLEITHTPEISSIVFNNDNQYLSEAFKYVVKSMGVGESRDSDFVLAVDRSEYTLPALSFVLSHRQTQEIARFTVNIWGKHNAMPLALAASVGHELGISLQESSQALIDFRALSGRGNVIMLDENKFIVDDAYNANPASMRASLETFTKIKTSGKLAVLGEMRELGRDEAKYHESLRDLLNEIDKVILVGKIWLKAFSDKSNYIFCNDWKQALEEINKSQWNGLLVKGSNSIGLSNIIKELV